MPSKGELQLLVLLISCLKYERFSKENLPIDHTRVPEVEPTIILMLRSPRLISFFVLIKFGTIQESEESNMCAA